MPVLAVWFAAVDASKDVFWDSVVGSVVDSVVGCVVDSVVDSVVDVVVGSVVIMGAALPSPQNLPHGK